MQWDTNGISAWFFERANVPSDVSATNNNPDPTTWPKPSAFYPASGCDPTTAFGPQIITIVCSPALSSLFLSKYNSQVHQRLWRLRRSSPSLRRNLLLSSSPMHRPSPRPSKLRQRLLVN